VFDPDTGGEMMKYRENSIQDAFFFNYGGRGVDPDRNEESRGLIEGLKLQGG
jgi:hypothetical protein